MTKTYKFDFHMGGQVHCLDGSYGKLAKLAIDPEFREVTHLVIEEGLLFKRARVVPVSMVERTEDTNIYLSCSRHQLDDYPYYKEKMVERLVEDEEVTTVAMYNHRQSTAIPHPNQEMNVVHERVRYGVPDSAVVLSDDALLVDLSGDKWQLETVHVFDDTYEIISMSAYQGSVLTEEANFSIRWVEEISEDHVTLDFDPHEYGTETVEWITATRSYADTVPLKPIRNPELVSDLINSFTADSRTKGSSIDVAEDNGDIVLTGRVSSIEAKHAAGEITAAHPATGQVTNNLVVI